MVSENQEQPPADPDRLESKVGLGLKKEGVRSENVSARIRNASPVLRDLRSLGGGGGTALQGFSNIRH